MSDYVYGVIVGASLVLVLAVVALIKLYRRNGTPKYDERQQAGRGKAFQAGFFTLLIGGAAVSIAGLLTELPGGDYVWHMLSLMVGIGVFAVTAIHYDAYVSMNDTPKRFMTSGAILAVAMLVSALANLLLEEDTNHTVGWVNLMLAVVWIVILAAMTLHNRKKAEDEE